MKRAASTTSRDSCYPAQDDAVPDCQHRSRYVSLQTMHMTGQQAMDLMLTIRFTQAEAERKLRRAKLSSTGNLFGICVLEAPEGAFWTPKRLECEEL